MHVKLVAEVGVGTVAAGVSKAHADVVLISGHDGGTGAAPLTSIKHAGAPWELGLAETQQTLLRGGLRDRIVVQADGQLKTGRDVIIAALLGAEEFGFASAPLVVSGCVMMRVCHLDTCPVGVATQNPELRKRFTGKPEFVVNFFEFIAQEVREYLAALGFRTLDEAVGRADLLDTAPRGRPLEGGRARPDPGAARARPARGRRPQQHDTPGPRDRAGPRQHADPARRGRAAGRHAGHAGASGPQRQPDRRHHARLRGDQALGRRGAAGRHHPRRASAARRGNRSAPSCPGAITLRLAGDANDYLGKGLSGGRIIVAPDPDATFAAEEQIIAGNVIGYGATGGEMFLRGVVGERFCVRNSGATAVAEGTGDHGCEYMTGGTVAVLGPVGRNFAAGMSGGVAYLLDPDPRRVNTEMADLEPLDDRATPSCCAAWSSATSRRPARRWRPGCWPTGTRRVPRFGKVMPKDYKRVLDAARRAEREGRDVNEAVMAAAHG